LLTRVASADGRRLGSTVIDTHNLAELHGVRSTLGGSPTCDPTRLRRNRREVFVGGRK
jgi:hypothetical protein